MDDRYLSLKQLAEYASVSKSTLRNLLSEIPHHTIGKKIIVKRSEFDRWLARKGHQMQRLSPRATEWAERIFG